MKDLIICCGIGLNMFFPVYLVIPARPKVKGKDFFVEPAIEKFKGHQTVMFNRTQHK